MNNHIKMRQLTDLFCIFISYLGMGFTATVPISVQPENQTVAQYSIFLVCFIIWVNEFIRNEIKSIK